MRSLLLAVLIAAPSAGSAPAPDFDGRSPSAGFALPRPALSPDPVPLQETGVPRDIKDAAALWGNQVQYAKLLSEHPAPKASFSFAVLGDIEPGRFPWERVFAPKGAFGRLMALIHAESPDLIVQLGDFVSKGTPKNYRKYVALLGKVLNLPMLTVIGNHDRPETNGTDGDKSLYKALFGDLDFAYDYNGWRFIGLDTSNRKLRPAQLEWLASVLVPGGRSLIFTHVPPEYLKGRISSVDPGLEGQANNMSGYFQEGSAEFERLITAAGVKRVYMGHIHAYGTADRGGVRYVLSGGGGSPLYPLPPGYPKRKFAHFVLVTVGPSGISERVIKTDASELEEDAP